MNKSIKQIVRQLESENKKLVVIRDRLNEVMNDVEQMEDDVTYAQGLLLDCIDKLSEQR